MNKLKIIILILIATLINGCASKNNSLEKEEKKQINTTNKSHKIKKIPPKGAVEELARLNYPRSQYEMGVIAYREKDNKKALEWFLKSAKQNYDEAQLAAGLMYYYPRVGIKYSKKKAMYWLEKAALQGNMHARSLVKKIINDKYTKKTENADKLQTANKLSVTEITPVQNNNLVDMHTLSPEDQYNLGLTYYQQQRYNKALQFFQKSASQGFIKAQYSLAMINYNQGDYNNAFYWFEKSAISGLADSQYAVGNMLYYGQGVQKNNDLALKWLVKSANQNYFKAKNLLENTPELKNKIIQVMAIKDAYQGL